jgi:hypothetical protein
VDALKTNTNLFTRMTEPHKPERVEELLRLVTIGDDLSLDEKQTVRKLISDFADIFALSVSEVKTVEDAIHHLDIPPDATFSLKVNQKPLTPPQRRYLYESIDTMLEAGVIEACNPEDVKCISAKNYNIESTTNASPVEWTLDLTCHPELHQPQTTPPKTNPSGESAKTSRKSTKSPRLRQCRRETSGRNNSA